MKKYSRAAAVLQGLGVYLVFILLPVGLTLGASLISPKLGNTVLDFLSLFPALPSALLLLLLQRFGGQGIGESAGWRFSKAPLASHGAALLFGLLMSWVVISALTLLPEPVQSSYGEQADGVIQESLWLTLLSATLAAPVLEEILFRGMIFRLFRKALPFGWAAVLSALLFGSAHVHPVWIAYTFVLGFFLAWLTERTGTVTVSIAAHIGFNLTSSLLSFLPVALPDGVWFWVLVGLLAAGGAAGIWWLCFRRGKWSARADAKIAENGGAAPENP